MKSVFKNPVKFNQIVLLTAYLSGQQIQYTETRNPSETSIWEDIPKYKYPSDVYQLAGRGYSFRVKPE